MLSRLLTLVAMIIITSGCKYHKGDIYTSSLQNDSLRYVIAAKGSGKKMSEKASMMKMQHESKGNTCIVKYLSDSASLQDIKSILLFNAILPEMENDMLSKGYFGTFTSKQSVTYLLVSDKDFDSIFIKNN
jgi:hypothetical protein